MHIDGTIMGGVPTALLPCLRPLVNNRLDTSTICDSVSLRSAFGANT